MGWVGQGTVVDALAAAKGEKVFLLSQARFCRLSSVESGDFASNSASKIVETSSALGWKCLQCHSCRNKLRK